MSEFEALGLSGLFARAVKRFEDERGFFQELVRTSALDLILPRMVQDNLSYSTGDVVRGMHLQENQWQVLTILKGSILDITIDVSKDSPTFMRTCSIELSESNLNQLIIPPNVAHGFCTLSNEVLLMYKSSLFYGETPQYGVAWYSEEIADFWPKKNWTVSKRDSSFPTLDKFLSQY